MTAVTIEVDEWTDWDGTIDGAPMVDICVTVPLDEGPNVEREWWAAVELVGRLAARLLASTDKDRPRLYCGGIRDLDIGGPPCVEVSVPRNRKRETLESITAHLRAIAETTRAINGTKPAE